MFGGKEGIFIRKKKMPIRFGGGGRPMHASRKKPTMCNLKGSETYM
jgi:hypothetical protein